MVMKIALKAVEGPLAGQIFPIEKPMTIGRQGDIALDDIKISSLHARIEPAKDGQFLLIDNDSKNGITVNNQKIQSIQLDPGLVFTIGSSSFEVIKVATAAAPAASSPAKPRSERKSWYQILADFLTTHQNVFEDRALPLVPLRPALVLEFVRGLQMNSKWVIGYGPRKLGSASIDLPIWEPDAPKVCFEIHPTADGILFKTAHPDIVQLNQQSVDSRILRMGDTITINETLIEVDFTE